MNPLDERWRFEAAAQVAGELLRHLDGLASGPAGRHLRRAVDSGGRHLLGQAEVGGRLVWVPAALLDVLRALRAATPHHTCPKCSAQTDPKCKQCRGAGYVPERPGELALHPAPRTLPVEGDVAEVWGWLETLNEEV